MQKLKIKKLKCLGKEKCFQLAVESVHRINSLSSNLWITGVETIKRQTMAAYCCLVEGQSLWAQV